MYNLVLESSFWFCVGYLRNSSSITTSQWKLMLDTNKTIQKDLSIDEVSLKGDYSSDIR